VVVLHFALQNSEPFVNNLSQDCQTKSAYSLPIQFDNSLGLGTHLILQGKRLDYPAVLAPAKYKIDELSIGNQLVRKNHSFGFFAQRLL
jgi:hypothetical protein